MSGFPNDFWDLLQCLVEIGAPTGQEGKRVDFIQSWLQKQTRWPINRNAEDCLVLDLRASDQKGARVPLLDAHVDTVFPDLHLSIRKEEAYWHAPGISDNTTSVALLMILARALHTTGQHFPLLIAFSTGEESFGNLRGIREILREWQSSISHVLAMDLDLDQFSLSGPGSKRWELSLKGKGGHSWKDFSTPNPFFVFTDWLSKLRNEFQWAPKLDTLNVRLDPVASGVSSIPTVVSGELEIRSTSQKHLLERSEWVEKTFADMAQQFGLSYNVESMGERPAGNSPREGNLLFQVLSDVHNQLGIPMKEVVASTNTNLPSSLGIPSICTGFFMRNNTHTREELLHIHTVEQGWQKLWQIAQRLITAQL